MLPAYNTVIFDGTDLNSFRFFSTGSGTYAAPERAVEVVEVPGRSGDLVFDNERFKNITVSYPGFIGEDLETNFRNLRSYLLSKAGNYLRLEDTYHPDEFRLAYFKGPINPSVDQLSVATLTLDFICKPQRYLKSGEIVKTFTQNNPSSPANGGITNPSYFYSSPLIRIYGYGRVGISGTVIEVSQHSYDYVDVDSELMDCFNGLNNLNSYVGFSTDYFPRINPGGRQVNLLDTTVTKVEITPRWWVL